ARRARGGGAGSGAARGGNCARARGRRRGGRRAGSDARLTDQDVLVLVDARLGALRRLALRFDLELAGLLVAVLRLHGNDLVARGAAGMRTGERGNGDAATDLCAVEARGSRTAGLAGVVGAELHAERTRVVAGAVLIAARIAVRAGHRPGGGEGAAAAG